MQQGIKAITDYKATSHVCDGNALPPDALNNFCSHPNFHQPSTLSVCSGRLSRVFHGNLQVLTTCPGNVLISLQFTDIFIISLSQADVPTCFKLTTIISVMPQ